MKNTKKCNTCGEVKFVSGFPKGKGGRYGVRGDCKVCHSMKNKIKCPKRKEERRKYMKEYYENNKDKWERTKEKNEKRNRRRRERYASDPDYREKRLKEVKEFRKRNPKYKRSNELKYKYGITYECFKRMRKDQNYKCKICTRKLENESQSYVDHCHETGNVRGILCNKCNFGIGHFDDDINQLKEAIKYLKESERNWKNG